MAWPATFIGNTLHWKIRFLLSEKFSLSFLQEFSLEFFLGVVLTIFLIVGAIFSLLLAVCLHRRGD